MSTSLSGLSTNYFPSAENGFTTTTSGSVASGAATVGLNSVAGYTNGEIAVFVIDPTDATKKQTFTGVIDTGGVQVTSVVWTAGTNQTHALGATVVDYATATHISMITKGLIAAGLNQAGTMTPKVATSINDTNGNEVIKTPATASAVNEITVTNAATGNDPRISATGGDTTANLNLRGKGLAKTVTIGAGSTTIFPYDYVVSGCVWSGDSYGASLAASMTSGVVVINGSPITVAAVTARAFTASKDTYIDVLDAGDGTGTVVYTEATNNAASSALAANSIRIGIIQSGATITAVGAVNQGQEFKVLPIASSIPYAVTDSLGNLICPRDPNRKILGYREITSNATATTQADVTALTVPVIVPSGRKIKIVFDCSSMSTNIAIGAGTYQLFIMEGATQLAHTAKTSNGSGHTEALHRERTVTPTAGLHTYKIQMASSSATVTLTAASDSPSFIRVELV